MAAALPTAAQTFDGDTPWRERTNVHRVREEAARQDVEDLTPQLWIHTPEELLRWPLTSEDVWPFGGPRSRPPEVRVNALARLLILAGVVGTVLWGREALYVATASAAAVAFVQESAAERWKVLAEKMPGTSSEEELLAQMRHRAATQTPRGDDVSKHALKGVNSNPFDYGKTFCADMPGDSGGDDVDAAYSTGEASLGLFINQLPDPTGCGRSPFFGDLPPLDPVGPERNCAYRQCR